MVSSKQPSSTTQTTIQKLPEWVEAASQSNYKFAQEIANKPYTPYTGQVIANPSQSTLDAENFARGSVGRTQDYTTAAAHALHSADLKLDPTRVASTSTRDVVADQVAFQNVKAGLLSGTNLDPYFNPYIDAVEKTSLSALEDSRKQSLLGNADSAQKAKAFGGSRSGIIDAVTNAQAAKGAGALSANIRAQGFDTAVANATADINRTFDADKFNSTGQYTAGRDNADRKLTADTGNADRSLRSDMANADRHLQSQTTNNSQALALAAQKPAIAAGFNSIANDAQARSIQDYGLLSSVGQAQTARDQAALDQKRGEFEAEQNYDVDRLNLLLSSLGMSPYGKSETSTKTSTSESKGPDWMSVGTGVLKLLPSLFALSDETEKTDIKKIGKDKATGIDLYSYRYKGDPKTYPKVVGPMAQDVEKKIPNATKRVGGKLAVKHEILGALAGNGSR